MVAFALVHLNLALPFASGASLPFTFILPPKTKTRRKGTSHLKRQCRNVIYLNVASAFVYVGTASTAFLFLQSPPLSKPSVFYPKARRRKNLPCTYVTKQKCYLMFPPPWSVPLLFRGMQAAGRAVVAFLLTFYLQPESKR